MRDTKQISETGAVFEYLIIMGLVVREHVGEKDIWGNSSIFYIAVLHTVLSIFGRYASISCIGFWI